jgi:glycosyltransferase involved in cell wall biosynthesis
MRILYDGSIYQWQSAGGINRYFANLISHLPENFEPVLTTCRRRRITYPAHPRLRVLGFERFRPLRVSLKLEGAYLRRVAAAEEFDLVHPTYYTLLSQVEMRRSRRPLVLTVWDMIHELFPEHFIDGAEMAHRKREAIEVAQAIICISENTKKDLLEHYPYLPEERVRVTHLASELNESMAYGPEPIPSRPYFLHVGARGGYKNFGTLLTAFSKLSGVYPELALCVVGVPLNTAERREIAEMKLSGRIEHYGQVSDSQLAKLYKHSVAFVYPSLYEGFGIPLVEAMACGTAVVASNRSSLPEVVVGAGLLFDPAADDLADVLAWLIDNPTERERLVALGLDRAREFSWDRTVAQTLEVYQSVIN